jgi:RNase P/RNase MRP subunit p29
LGELGRHVRIRAIHQLPASPNDGEAISVDGSFIPLRPENAHRLLAGQINLSAHTSQAELEACASNPYLTLDITHVPLRVLDTLDRTAGSLRTAARRVSLNRLISIEGGLFCRRPENVEMRALQSIGASQLCHGAREVQQDNQRCIGGN